MIILAIETSCDETGVAIIHGNGGSHPHFEILVNLLASQIAIHKKYGGVVPHLAAREHEKNLPILLARAWRRAKQKNISPKDIDLIAVTKGPGLSPALWRGINFAKELSEKMDKPLVGVDHMRGHIAANFIDNKGYEYLGASPEPCGFPPQAAGYSTPFLARRSLGSKQQNVVCFAHSLDNKISGIFNFQFSIFKRRDLFPALALVVSGGHTQLVLMKKLGSYELLGETLDDAAGEAFDKVARMLGLPYPGGPEISKLAKKSNSAGFAFPRPMLTQKNYNFSFSGLKTAVLYTVRDIPKLTAKSKRDVAASFQQAVIDVLIAKTIRAAREYNVRTIMLAGGVAANSELRAQMRKAVSDRIPNSQFYIPDSRLCTDNAAMIGAAAYISLLSPRKKHAAMAIQAEPSRQIDDP